jgi:hypothetical protein
MATARTGGVCARQRPADSKPARAAGRDRQPGKGYDRLPGFQVFRQIVSMTSVTLPVAGMVTSYDPRRRNHYPQENT